MIEHAIDLNAHFIAFPELSITNYEPSLAKKFATDTDHAIFTQFQKISDTNDITIGVGMPTKSKQGIRISMLIFQANTERTLYSKQMLDVDELPYFYPGKEQIILNCKGEQIALGICYESMHQSHFENVMKSDASIYLASVAKPKKGIRKAYSHFPEMAKAFQIPILMSNCIGPCDIFLSTGQSAVWNKNGKLLNQLDESHQGLLIYDTERETANRHQLF